MYAHFYQLSENPFNLTPDPKFHYINESTREAMASLLHGIKGRKGFLTLIGEAGTGKTTLLKRVLDEIEGETQVVFVFNPGVSFDELLEFICMELGVATDGSRRLQLLDRLNAHLLEQLTSGRNVVVMIDEAQTLDEGVLEELRLLSNLETAKEKILQILLSGQPELEEKLRKPNLRQLRQRIAVRATLKPMRPDEVGPYVETRLRSAGADRIDFFTPSALRKVWRASKGIPRVVNVICDNAMMIAFAEGKRRITNHVIAEAIRDLQGSSEGGVFGALRDWFAAPAVRYAAGALAGIALAVPVALAVLSGRPSDAEHVAADTAAQPFPSAPTPHPTPSAPVAPSVVLPVPSSAEEEADRAVESSPSASSVDSDLRISGTIRDQMRRAETLARSTAARLYHTQDPDAELAGEPSAQAAAPRPMPRPSAPEALSPSSRTQGASDVGFDKAVPPEGFDKTVPPAGFDKPLASDNAPSPVDDEDDAFVGDEKDTADAFAEPEPYHRETLRLGQPGTKLDDSALASLQAPLADGEAEAFASSPDPLRDAKGKSDATVKGALPREAIGERKPPVAPAVTPEGNVGLGAMKPVKAGTVAVEKPVEEKKPSSAAVEPAKTAPSGSTVQPPPPAAASPTGARAQVGESTPKRDESTPNSAGVVPPKTPDKEINVASAGAAPSAAAAPPAANVPSGASSEVAAVDPDTFKTSGPDASEPIIGQLVRVLPGDTVWDIAVAYYGTAGPTTMKRILNGNPGIRDPRHLDVGGYIYLPWQRPEQMVGEGSDGTYSILLAVSPVESRLGSVRRWVETLVPNAKFATAIVNGADRMYQLRLVGLPSREAALQFATDLLEKPAPARHPSAGRNA